MVCGKRILPRRSGRGRPLEDLSKLRIGLAAVVVLAVVVGVTVFVNSLHLGKETYRADFAQAAGVSAGDGVTLAGIEVGNVTGTKLAGDHVVVTMKLNRGLPLGADTGAAIKLTTLLGSRYIELRPAGAGHLPGNAIVLSHTEVPYDLETALQNATTTFGSIDADQVAQTMSALTDQLHSAPALVPETLRNMKTLAAVIGDRRAQLGQLLTSTDQVTSLLRDQQAELAGMITQGRNVLQQLISRQQAIVGLLDAATGLVQQLKPIAVDDQPEIQQLLDNLTQMTGMIAGHDDLLRNILQILPVPWRLFANATGTGQELVGNGPDGAFIDSFMCALSGYAQKVNQPTYFQDCK
ncbi:virulence factor Mce-like protein [Nocardia transvalensis]|uniref:Virulence factor Mce-like protein n=1 Tax=Nocardia transvalensis TaxID=37333 RepID=A0A7W9PI25_9NOCA|nr:MCE family protein [Nocardia transvalensis]MBB5915989.1 virulence factor Mce-like protein [Nocardia transvalensis]